jgi:hypothetical protein
MLVCFSVISVPYLLLHLLSILSIRTLSARSYTRTLVLLNVRVRYVITLCSVWFIVIIFFPPNRNRLFDDRFRESETAEIRVLTLQTYTTQCNVTTEIRGSCLHVIYSPVWHWTVSENVRPNNPYQSKCICLNNNREKNNHDTLFYRCV